LVSVAEHWSWKFGKAAASLLAMIVLRSVDVTGTALVWSPPPVQAAKLKAIVA
jgi:hypothetical protein